MGLRGDLKNTMYNMLPSVLLQHDPSCLIIVWHSVGCCFCLIDCVSFALQKLLSFEKSHLLILALSVSATGVIFRKWSFVPIHSKLLPTFSFMMFNVTGSTWTWILCMATDMDLFAIFYMFASSYDSTICWRCFPFSKQLSTYWEKIFTNPTYDSGLISKIYKQL